MQRLQNSPLSSARLTAIEPANSLSIRQPIGFKHRWCKSIIWIIFLITSVLLNIFHIVTSQTSDIKLAWISFSVKIAAACGLATMCFLEEKNSDIRYSNLKIYVIFSLLVLCFTIFEMILYDVCYSSHQIWVICILELIFIYVWTGRHINHRWQIIPLAIGLMLYGIISNGIQNKSSYVVFVHEIVAAAILILLEMSPEKKLPPEINSEGQKTCEMLLNYLPDLITVVSDTKDVIFANKAYQQLAIEMQQSPQSLDLLSQITELRFKEEKSQLIELLRVESQFSDSKSIILEVNDEMTAMKQPIRDQDVFAWRNTTPNAQISDLKMEHEPSNQSPFKKKPPKTAVVNCDLAKAIMIIIQNFERFREIIGEDLAILYGKLNKGNGTENKYEIKLSCPIIMKRPVLLVSLSDTTHRDKVLKLEEISRFKSGLLGAFSHELRTPLNANLNFLTAAVQDLKIPVELREKLIIPALRNAELLMYLVCDILDFSQMNTKALTLNFSKQNVEQLMTDLVTMFNIQSKQKKLNVEFEIDKEVPREIRTDFQRLKQVLINLLRYAISHTFNGNIHIKVSSFGMIPRVYRFLVQNDGASLSSDEPLKLLDFLYDAPDKDGYENVPKESMSLTLGLKIASKLSELLCPARKGGLRFQSAQNTGSAFYFYVEDLAGETDYLDIQFSSVHEIFKKSPFTTELKMALPEAVLKGSYLNETVPGEVLCSEATGVNNIPISDYKLRFAANNKPRTTSLFDNQRKNLPREEQINFINHRTPIVNLPEDIKIVYDQNVCGCHEALIVDDDAFNILSLGVLLNKIGINYEEAYDGQLALDRIQAKKRCCEDCRLYSIIFMDCNMPVKDGYQTTAELKEMMEKKTLPFIPIVACTAYAIDYQATKCKKVGMDEYLTKPVNQKMLLDIVKRWCLI